MVSVDGQSGLARAGDPGTAWLVASAGAARDSVLVTVAAVVAGVEIDQQELSIEVGDEQVLSATVIGSDQRTLDRDVAWASSDASVVMVDAVSGRITAREAGTADISASVESFSSRVMVTVEDAAPVLPSVEAVRSAIGVYLSVLNEGDGDEVTRYWGTGDEDSRNELLDDLDERNFEAALGSVGDPSLSDDVVVVTFVVTTSWRTFAGGGRDRPWSFRAQLDRVGSESRITSCVGRQN